MKNNKENFLSQLGLYQDIFEDLRDINVYLKSQKKVNYKVIRTAEMFITVLIEDIKLYTRAYYADPRFIKELKDLEYKILNILELKAKDGWCSKRVYKKLLDIAKNLSFTARIQESIIAGYNLEYVDNKRKNFQAKQLESYYTDIMFYLSSFENSLEKTGSIEGDPKIFTFFKTTFNLVLFIVRDENPISQKNKEQLSSLPEKMNDLIKRYVSKHEEEYKNNFYKFSWIGIFNYYSKELDLLLSDKSHD